ncbi:MAG: ABC transporter permease, partial [Bacteroidales bacterium]|nr:ABC transporter permease [Bacteroidales bacterium]
FGSTTKEILALFNTVYLKILVICFVIAAPIAYYFINKWLEGFAYKTPLYWWVFVLSFVVIAAVTLVTVTIQNLRAANANPLDSIR